MRLDWPYTEANRLTVMVSRMRLYHDRTLRHLVSSPTEPSFRPKFVPMDLRLLRNLVHQSRRYHCSTIPIARVEPHGTCSLWSRISSLQQTSLRNVKRTPIFAGVGRRTWRKRTRFDFVTRVFGLSHQLGTGTITTSQTPRHSVESVNVILVRVP